MTAATALVWHAVAGVLSRRGRPNPRPGLVYGQYQPQGPATPGTNGVTAGLVDASLLTAYNAPSTQNLTLTDGQTFNDQIIYGDLRPPNPHNSDIVLNNCYIRGGSHIPSTNWAVVNCDNTRSGNGRVILNDCEIYPQNSSLNRDGIRGNRIEVYRSYIHDSIDGFFGFARLDQNTGAGQLGAGVAGAKLMGCVIENLVYYFPNYENGVSGTDPATVTYPTKPADWETNDGCHNDPAVMGSPGVHIKGNLLRATSYHGPGSGNHPVHDPGLQASGYANGQCVLVEGLGAPLNLTSILEENWLYGGISHVSIDSNETAIVRNNHHYRAVYVGPTLGGYWIRHILRAGDGVNANSDTWIDGPYAGNVLIEPRTLGVHFNA